MDWGRIAGVSLLMVGLASASAAADNPTLADAAEQRNKALVRSLLAARADVNAAQVDGMTALHWAVYHDDVEMAGLLVRSGARINATNLYGVPPLSLACTNGNADLVKMLLEAGADANTALPEGETCLMSAAATGNLRAVKALLRRGAAVNAKEGWKGQTALMWAAAERHTAVVDALIEAGADVHARSKGGFTALLAAIIAVQQNDIKRILAYSTVSQLGYMMMGLGVGGVAVGMFHLITHAFFKALLFMGAGSVIHGCHEEQDIRNMGGIRKFMPVTFATTEHFNLQTARALTVSEANGRASIYLAALSGNLIALAFIGQMSELGAAFYAFALILLPVLAFVGW